MRFYRLPGGRVRTRGSPLPLPSPPGELQREREREMLSHENCEAILDALGAFKETTRRYDYYPSEDFRRQQIGRIERAQAAVKAIRAQVQAGGAR